MGVEKFNQHANGRYTEKYVENPKFRHLYDLTQEHMVQAYGRLPVTENRPHLIDIGAGPGVGAMLADRANLEARMTGFEPSDTHQDGVCVAEQLRLKGSSVEYTPIRGGLEKAAEISERLEGAVMIRAAHEIVESVGGKSRFYELMERVLKKMNDGGFFVITEPQYNAEITANPDANRELIEACKKFQMENIGHSHEPGDYISADELIQNMKSRGFSLARRDLKPNQAVADYLLKQGIKVDKSPFEIYALTFIKE